MGFSNDTGSQSNVRFYKRGSRRKVQRKIIKKYINIIIMLFFTVSISFLSIKNLITTNMILFNDKIVPT